MDIVLAITSYFWRPTRRGLRTARFIAMEATECLRAPETSARLSSLGEDDGASSDDDPGDPGGFPSSRSPEVDAGPTTDSFIRESGEGGGALAES
ncbi:hypothetical protein KM043_003797 [Ampulex compressa]|nr:hypothetical protein KM043_003797 [Ampulex compressa]